MIKIERFALIIGILLFFPLVNSAEITANYQIVDKTIIVDLTFEEVSELELKIPYDIKALELNIEKYEIIDFGNYNVINVDSADNLNIKYLTKSQIDSSKKQYFFTLQNPFNNLADIKLYLPESAILGENRIIFPKPNNIQTDGRRIILSWDNFDEDYILVEYEFIEKDTGFLYIIIGVLILFIFILYLTQKKIMKKEIKKVKSKGEKGKQQKEEELTKNLFEDEKRIVKYLLGKKGNESWTKEIIKELNISKVKLSRKLRSLEQKEIIKRIPYGNENKIRLLKEK